MFQRSGRRPIHLRTLKYGGTTRCGEFVPSRRAVSIDVWRCLPANVQCRNCSRVMPTRLCATEEMIVAVEVALHAIAAVWK
jgi:hypothetical protein